MIDFNRLPITITLVAEGGRGDELFSFARLQERMLPMVNSTCKTAACAALFVVLTTSAQAASLVPLGTFGGGDGWRAPFEVLAGDAAGTDSISPGLYNYLGNAVTDISVNEGNLERGLAYNAATGNLVLVSRNDAAGTLPSIRLLDGATGVDVGSLNKGTGVIAGGNFAINMVGIADDGAIYVGNLTSNTAGANGPFKLYRWADETSAAPTLAFSGDPLNGSRLGDTLDVIGSGANTRLVAGYGTVGAATLSNSFALFTTSDGTSFTAADVSLTATPPGTLPPNGDFRLGITFTDSDTVIGKSTQNAARVVNLTSTTAGDVTADFSTDGIVLRPMDYAVVAGKPLVAMVEASSDQSEAGRARIFVYDMTDLSLPLAERKIGEASALPFTPGGPNQFVNGNAVGQVKFGAIEGNTAIIYAMSTNNGIQAFELTLDAVAENNGDYNGDGIVDVADYVVWRKTEGENVDPLSGADGDGDGVIGPGDYDHWSARFGNVIGGGAGVAIPEPTGALLALLALAGLFARRGKR
jgi:hypothetical protein